MIEILDSIRCRLIESNSIDSKIWIFDMEIDIEKFADIKHQRRIVSKWKTSTINTVFVFVNCIRHNLYSSDNASMIY